MVKHIFLMFFVLFVIPSGANCREKNIATEEATEVTFAGFVGWTKNPSLVKEVGLWLVRTWCWSIGADCPDDLLLSKAEWVDDGDVFLKAQDDNTTDLGCDCAGLTQGTGFDGSIRGDPLTRIRTGDVESAYILIRRGDCSATPCGGIIGAAGNIINLWLRHPDGSIWVTDFYFETEGANSGFDERAAPHSGSVTREKGVDWYAYQIILKNFPEYWDKVTYPDGSEYWVIDLKALLERGSDYSERDLSDYLWYYVDVVSEHFCVVSDVGESASWQRIHYFEIKVKFRE